MNKLFVCLSIIALISPAVSASTVKSAAAVEIAIEGNSAQQNLIGEVVSVDPAAAKIVIQTDAKASVSVAFDDKTAFRRVQPGQTSLANAETIKITDIKPGDRVLVPGWSADAAQTPAKQIVVMPRAAIEQTRSDEQERRRARTVGGRITAVNPDKKEITIESRGRANPGTIVIDASANTKLLRYAPDSLRSSDAVAGSFADFRIGDQIRVLGDRSADGTRMTAEEIISGSVSRTVGTIAEINTARGEVVVKNEQNGQTMTVAIGKNTNLRRITTEAAAALKERFERRAARRQERNSGNADTRQPNRERRRRRDNDGQRNNAARRQPFENLPEITLAGLKKGDAVLITGTSAGGSASAMTAVSIIAGDGELQQILMRTQGGGRNSNMSPGLPGNVSGGNAGSDDDEP